MATGKKHIDEAPEKLKQSQLYNYPNYATLIDEMIEYVLPFWNNKWRFTKELSGIINKRKLNHELEESIPALTFVFKMINDIIINNKNDNKLSIPIIDLCSGKGILSILIASFIKLVPRYNHLFKYINTIYLLDRSWDLNFIEKEEMKNKKEDYTKQAKCPIKSAHLQLISNAFGIQLIPIRTNIHNEQIIKFINNLNNNKISNNKIILLSIHLCRRLSVRAIKLFNLCKYIYGYLLAPCCLPLRGGYNIRIGPLWNKTYNLWGSKNKGNIDVNKQYLINGIMPYLINDKNDSEVKEDNNELVNNENCCFQLALFSNKQISERNKVLGNKFILNENDVSMLNKCDNNWKQIDVNDEMNEIFIASEMIPKDLFELDSKLRYNQWITFLFNGIDTENNQKKIYRVPLTGNEHRCDAYLTVQRS